MERNVHLSESTQHRDFEDMPYLPLAVQEESAMDYEGNVPTPPRTKRPARVDKYGYGGVFECSPPDTPMSCESPSTKLNWAKARCVPRMTNVFVFMKEEFLLRDKGVPRFMLDAKDHDWFWRIAAQEFNKPKNDAGNYNLFKYDDSYPEEIRKLDPYYRKGCEVTAGKLKSEFRDLRSLFTKAFSNFRQSGMGEKDNADDDENRGEGSEGVEGSGK